MQDALKRLTTLVGILTLSAGYGYYTTLARVKAASPEATATVAVAELASSASALLWGLLADYKGSKVAAIFGYLSAVAPLLGTSPLHVFLCLSFFYAPFVTSLLVSSMNKRLLGEAVAMMSLGWGLGVSAIWLGNLPYLASASFVLGTTAVTVSIPNARLGINLMDALRKLRPLAYPLAVFMAAEYVAYALTALRFYELADPLTFVLSYAVGPSLTSFLGGYVAGSLVERKGEERVLIASLFAYPLVVALALLAPPPWCLLSWSIPVYPFYETALLATVTKLGSSSPGVALGFTYMIMALASLFAIPLTNVKDFVQAGVISIIMMLLAAVWTRKVLEKFSPSSEARRRASRRP